MNLAVVRPLTGWCFATPLLYSSLKVRPIADDYCIGAWVAENGIFSTAYTNYMNQSGEFTSMILNGFIVGFPLSNLPLGFQGIFILLATALSMSLVFSSIYSESLKRDLLKMFLSYGGWIISAFTLYFWLNNLLSPSDEAFRVATSITSWGTLQAAYVVPYALSIAFAARLISSGAEKHEPKAKKVLVLLIGLVLGMTPLVSALSLWAVLALAFVANLARRMINFRAFVGVLGVTAGLIVQYLSPGLRKRSGRYSGSEPVSREDLAEWPARLRWILNPVDDILLGILFSPATLVVFSLSILFGLRSDGEFFSDVKKIPILAPFAPFYLLSIAVLARFGELYSYEAFWHFIGLRLSIFLIVVMGGLFVGHKIEKSLLKGNREVIGRAEMLTIGVLLFGSLMSFVIIDRNSHLSGRLEAWKIGPAPISVMRDIEEEGHWARTCWLTLKDRVGLNDRL